MMEKKINWHLMIITKTLVTEVKAWNPGLSHSFCSCRTYLPRSLLRVTSRHV